MKKIILALAGTFLLSMPAHAAVLQLSTSNMDANAGNSLSLGVGGSASMFVWVSTRAGQTITGLSTSILSSDAGVLEGTAHITQNPSNRWHTAAGAPGEGTLGDLVVNTNAFVLFGQTGITTANENTFVLHSEVQFNVTGAGTTQLTMARGNREIVEGTGFTRIPDSDLALGTGSVTVVPEPGSLSLVGLALVGAARIRRRRR